MCGVRALTRTDTKRQLERRISAASVGNEDFTGTHKKTGHWSDVSTAQNVNLTSRDGEVLIFMDLSLHWCIDRTFVKIKGAH